MRDFGLGGRVVLVKNATHIVGQTIARMFAANGAWIAVNYLAEFHSTAKSLVDAIRSDGGRALLVPGDVGVSETAWRVARKIELEWAQIDVMIYVVEPHDTNAAVAAPLLSELLPGMRHRNWGRVVTISTADCLTDDKRRLLAQLLDTSAILVNVIRLPTDPWSEPLLNAVACITLWLGSASNDGVTGMTLSIDTLL